MAISPDHGVHPETDAQAVRELAQDLVSLAVNDDAIRRNLAEIRNLGGVEGLRATVHQLTAQRLLSLKLDRSLADLSGAVTPAAAQRSAATDSMWRGIEEEFGLLTAEEVGRQAGAQGRTYASDKRRAGHLFGVRRLNRILYPGFQFDDGTPRPIIRRLRQTASALEIPEEAVLLWMVSPTTWWGDDSRPVDHLDDEDGLLGAFASRFGTAW